MGLLASCSILLFCLLGAFAYFLFWSFAGDGVTGFVFCYHCFVHFHTSTRERWPELASGSIGRVLLASSPYLPRPGKFTCVLVC
jgi:hypothetical protein